VRFPVELFELKRPGTRTAIADRLAIERTHWHDPPPYSRRTPPPRGDGGAGVDLALDNDRAWSTGQRSIEAL
jgi:hypothetical protein